MNIKFKLPGCFGTSAGTLLIKPADGGGGADGFVFGVWWSFCGFIGCCCVGAGGGGSYNFKFF